MSRLYRFIVVAVFALGATWLAAFGDSGMSLSRSDAKGVEILFDMPAYQVSKVTTERGIASTIETANQVYLAEEGKPNLPLFTEIIEVPATGVVRMEMEILRDGEIRDVLPVPYRNLEDTPMTWDEAIYASGALYPATMADISEPAVMRYKRLVSVRIMPFQYDAKTGGLRTIESARIRISFDTRSQGVNEYHGTMPLSRTFEAYFSNTLLNYREPGERDMYQEPSILYIYRDDATVLNNLTPLTTWKHKQGYVVNVASTSLTGTTTATIKNYILNAYTTWANPPEFLQLVGDASGSYGIPVFSFSWDPIWRYTTESDHPYACLTGTDEIEDVFLGRLSFDSHTDLQTIVAKTMNYEGNPNMTETAWYNKNLIVGDASYSGISCIATNYYVKEVMSDYNPAFVGNFTELLGGYGSVAAPTATQMNNALNDGRLFFNYRGWYHMSGWANDNSYINALTNTNKTGVYVIITCGTGSYSGSTSQTEAIIRKGTPSTFQGGVIAIGSATTGTHTAYNNCLSGGIFHGWFAENMPSAGEGLQRGKLHLWESYAASQYSSMQFFCHNNNLMGDPSLRLWKGIPQPLAASVPTTVAPGTDQIEIDVTSNSIPLEGAWVSILMGNDTVFSSDITDNQGRAFLNVGTSTTGSVSVTITKPGHKPYTGTLTIGSTTNALSITNLVVDDDNSGTSSGNSNAVFNPGETVELRVQLTNNGTASASGISGTLTSLTDYATITDNSETFGSIVSGANAYCADDFDIVISPDCPGGTELDFLMNLVWGATSVTKRIAFTVSGPSLMIDHYAIIDGFNQHLDPNETANINFYVHNSGELGIGALTATVSSADPNIEFPVSTSTYPNIAAGQIISNGTPFTVHAETSVVPGSQIPVTLTLDNGAGFVQQLTTMLTVGTPTITDPLGPDSYGYYIYDNFDANYNLAPAYQWVEIDPAYGGSGTSLNMTDTSEDDDQVIVVTLPFNIQFYGQTYTQLSICSNGWAAPGVTQQMTFRNWPLPGPLGPSPMIAAFWDDLFTSGGNVFTKYDSANHLYYVEWSRCKNEASQSTNETFQIIFYDEVYYPTPTNDTEFKIQYHTVNDIDEGTSSNQGHGLYSTVGIEDHSGLIGLQYGFNATYPAAAKPLQNNLALLVTTRLPIIQDPPEASVDTSAIEWLALASQNPSGAIDLGNTGESILQWQVSKSYVTDRTEERLTGGPDAYGYTWIDSNSPSGPTYSWIPTSANTVTLTMPSNDSSPNAVALPFTFNFYGQNYNSVVISPNGWIGFGSDSGVYNNTSIPSTSGPRPAIMPFWDDLNPVNSQGGSSPAGYVRYESSADRFVVWYDQVAHWTSSYGPYTFQVVLYPSGEFLFQYNTMNLTNYATVGIQNAAGTVGLQVAYNTAGIITNNLAIKFRMPYIDWLTVSPTSGSVTSGLSQNIGLSVTINPQDLGVYQCNLLFQTNDPAHASFTIPVYLTVTDHLYPPAKVQHPRIVMTGPHVTLYWDPVTTDDHGNPIEIDGYVIYGGMANEDLQPSEAFWIDNTTDTQYYLPDMGTNFPNFRFIVTAVKNYRNARTTTETRTDIRK